MENLMKVVKSIRIVAKKSKAGKTNHYVRVVLANDSSTDVWCDKGVVDLIKTAEDFNIEPIKGFTLERRISEKTTDEGNIAGTEKGKPYVAVVLTMFNDKEYFYFLDRSYNAIVELLMTKFNTEEAGNKKKTA